MPRIGPMELVVLLVIVLIIFGVGKLPQIGGAVGKSIREFRRAQQEDTTESKVSKPDEKALLKSSDTENKTQKTS